MVSLSARSVNGPHMYTLLHGQVSYLLRMPSLSFAIYSFRHLIVSIGHGTTIDRLTVRIAGLCIVHGRQLIFGEFVLILLVRPLE
jgi:hypothetical protein